MFNWDYFEGKCEISFTNGMTLEMVVNKVLIDPYGRPIALEVNPATIVNWNNVLGVKKL